MKRTDRISGIWMKGIIALLTGVMMIFMLCMSDSYAWFRRENSISTFSGGGDTQSVILEKYERDIHGKETDIPVEGAVFALYKVKEQKQHAEETEELVLEAVQTDSAGKIAVAGLEPGSYLFRETEPAYLYTFDTDRDGEKLQDYSFLISKKESGTVRVISYAQRLAGQMKITKTVVNRDGSELSEEQREQEFEFHALKGRPGAYTYSIDGGAEQLLTDNRLTLRHGQTAVFEKLPAGMPYAIAQTPVAGYETQGTNYENEIPLPDESDAATVEFLNIYGETEQEDGILVISKKLTGNTETTDEFVFRVHIGDDAEQEFQYRVESAIGERTEAVKNGEVIYLKQNEQAVFEKVAAGTKWRAEEIIPDGYVALVARSEGTILARQESHAAFVNHKAAERMGSLVIGKQVTGDVEQKVFEFNIQFSDGQTYPYYLNDSSVPMWPTDGKIQLCEDEWVTFVDLPDGIIWQVEEEVQDGFTASIRQMKGTIVAEEAGQAEFVNYEHDPENYESTGELLITKAVAGADDEIDREFQFKVELDDTEEYVSIKAGESVLFAELSAGTEYRVMELDTEGFIASIQRVEGQIPQNGRATAAFMNYAEAAEPGTGTVVVSKELAGNMVDTADQFSFSINFSDDKNYSFIMDGMEYETEDGTFMLSGGQNAEFINIPEGVMYTVVENPDDRGYIPVIIEQGGMVAAGEQAQASFINYRDEELTELPEEEDEGSEEESDTEEQDDERWIEEIQPDMKNRHPGNVDTEEMTETGQNSPGDVQTGDETEVWPLIWMLLISICVLRGKKRRVRTCN